MGFTPRLTKQTLKVLSVLMAETSGAELSGSEIAASTKLPSGTLYPILLRLERAGWLSSHWEKGDPTVLGRPRRRLYRVTAMGTKQIKAELKDLQAVFGAFAWT